MKSVGIYIHIPFCTKKCPYCDFYSIEPNEELIYRYTNTVCEQISRENNNIKIDSIYFGGGTPNLIGIKNIKCIIDTIKNNFIISQPEITIELNPSCHYDMNFYELIDTGINRLSIGMQSINDYELSILGRQHNSLDVKMMLSKARNAGFDNISFDIMIAIPKQTKHDLAQSLEFCVCNDIPHISVYLLKIEEGTRYFDIKNSLILPDEDAETALYLFTDEYLRNNGYKHYEISNFCKNGMESKHNLKYWNCDEYIGIGPSAHSFLNGKRYYYPRNIVQFIDKPQHILDGDGGSPEEYAMLRLRLSDGLINDDYKRRFGNDIPESYYTKAQKYNKLGLVNLNNFGINLTPKGFLLSNQLILNIIY